MTTWLEKQIGSLGIGAGLIWAAYIGTSNVTEFKAIFTNLLYTRGPLQLIGLSALIWLHAIYRKSVGVNRA